MSNIKKKSINAKLSAMFDMKENNVASIKHLRELLNQRDKLIQQLEANNHECDILKEVFSLNSREDVDHLIKEFFPTQQNIPPISAEEKTAFVNKIDLLKNYQSLKHLGFGIRRIDEKTLLIEFVPPENYTPPDFSLIKLEENENTYKLIHSLFPASVPIAELQKKYLEDANKQDFPAFFHSIQQYLWSFWKRDIEVQKIKNADYMKKSNIYHNKNRTVMSFTMHFLTKYIIEMKLLFSPLSYIPHKVDYLVQDEEVLPRDLVDALEEFKSAFLQYPPSAVLHSNLAGEESTDENSSGSFRTESSSTISELFK